MHTLPVFIPFICVLFLGFSSKYFQERYIQGTVLSLMLLNVIVCWLIAFGVIGSGKGVVYQWLNLANFSISFSIQWSPVTAYVSALVSTVFFALLLFYKRDIEIKWSKIHVLMTLCAMVFFFQTMIASDHIGQSIFGWQGLVIASFVLLGGVKKPGRNNRLSTFILAINLTGIIFFIAFIQMGNIIQAKNFLLDSKMFTDTIPSLTERRFFSFSPAQFLPYFLVCIMCIPFAILPFNAWVQDVFERSVTLAGFVLALHFLAGAYILYYILSIIDLSQNVRVFMAILSIVNLIISSLVAVARQRIHTAVSYLYSAASSTVFFAFAVFSVHKAFLFALAQFVAIVALMLNTGTIISIFSGEKDMLKMGGLSRRLPAVSFLFVIAIFSVLCIPPFSGFFLYIWLFDTLHLTSTTMFWLVFAGLVIGKFIMSITFGYIIGMVFYGRENFDERVSAHIESPSPFTIGSLLTISVLLLSMIFTAQYVFYVKKIPSALALVKDADDMRVFVPLLISVLGLLLGLKGFMRIRNTFGRLFNKESILANNFFIKDALTVFLYIPLSFIGKNLNVLERPAIQTVVEKTTTKIAKKTTNCMHTLCTISPHFFTAVWIFASVGLLLIHLMLKGR